jgi:folate-binding protein YgfZ
MTFLTQLKNQFPTLLVDEANPRLINTFNGTSKNQLEVNDGDNTLFHLGQYGVLNLVGDDAADFLHKQLSNDVLHLAEDGARHAAWCTAKGRMLASLIVYRQKDNIRLLLSQDLAEQSAKRLQMFVFRAKVKTTDITEHFEILGYTGNLAEQALLAAGFILPPALLKENELSTSLTGDVTIIRLETQRFILVIPTAEAYSYWTKLAQHATPVGIPAWEWLNIQAGLPVITQATCEAFVPQMVDFDLVGGINFKKGCYPAQEIVARTHYLGKVKRHLYRVTSNTPITAGLELHSPASPDQSVGMVISAVEQTGGSWVGLASILETAAGDLIPSMQASRVFDEAPQQQ